MATSSELKSRLRKFLADPQAETEFRTWFASLLIDIHQENDAEVESLVHAIHVAFSDAAEGLYTPAELRGLLVSLSREPIAVNQMISMQASVFSQSVNRLVEGRAFPAFPESAGTLPAVVFGSVVCHQG